MGYYDLREFPNLARTLEGQDKQKKIGHLKICNPSEGTTKKR
ncbi:MAG TPA: hypothetical protein VGA53_02165 [Candidatus Paceibacterota bacterium]